MLHELKIEPQYFEDILHNGKNFEVRKDDRPYEKEDYLHLKEYSIDDEYTGKEILAKVLYIYRGEFCLTEYCLMGIKNIDFWAVR